MSGKLHITLDYELFFGEKSGSVSKCLLEPTEKLLHLARIKKSQFIFFVDGGYLAALKKNQHHEQCQKDLLSVSKQLRQIMEEGHEIGLHVHPHWEDTRFSGTEWIMNTKRYKLIDFSREEVHRIIPTYHAAIHTITGKKCNSFRAGGWCIQPFLHIKQALQQEAIYIDSSVFPGGNHHFHAHSYDFRNAPEEDDWFFDNNECVTSEEGIFREFPISSDRVPPAFYFDLYFKMRFQPEIFRPTGDGTWLKDKKKIYRQFYTYTSHFASCDGFFASRLLSVLNRIEKQGKKRMVVLGHPKSMAPCSFEYLSHLIETAQQKNFKTCTFSEDSGK